MMTGLVLASSSPRRAELLRQAGIEPRRVLSPDIDETAREAEIPRSYAIRMANAKCDAALKMLEEPAFVLVADTVVACGRRILGKPEDEAEAERFLSLLSGRRHRVMTGFEVAAPDGRRAARLVQTSVAFKRLSRHELRDYIQSGEWRGKAGGYAIQGRAQGLIPSINGSYSNVVGLPLVETLACLHGLGFRS